MLQVVPAEVALVADRLGTVQAWVDGIVAGVRSPLHAQRRRQLATVFLAGIRVRHHIAGCVDVGGRHRLLVPAGDVVTQVDLRLDGPVLIQLDRKHRTFLGVRIVGVQQRMAVGVIVRRQLRFDVRHRDVAADAHVHAIGHAREVTFQVSHRDVVAVLGDITDTVGELVAPYAARVGVLGIRAPQCGHAEAPVEVLLLHHVRSALEVQRDLVDLGGIGLISIGRREVAAGAVGGVVIGVRGAAVKARIKPAVHGHAAVFPLLAVFTAIDGVHQRTVVRVLIADVLGAADRPVGERHGCARDRWRRIAFTPVRRGIGRIAVPCQVILVGADETISQRGLFRARRATCYRTALGCRGGRRHGLSLSGTCSADGDQAHSSKGFDELGHTVNSVLKTGENCNDDGLKTLQKDGAGL